MDNKMETYDPSKALEEIGDRVIEYARVNCSPNMNRDELDYMESKIVETIKYANKNLKSD